MASEILKLLSWDIRKVDSDYLLENLKVVDFSYTAQLEGGEYTFSDVENTGSWIPSQGSPYISVDITTVPGLLALYEEFGHIPGFWTIDGPDISGPIEFNGQGFEYPIFSISWEDADNLQEITAGGLWSITTTIDSIPDLILPPYPNATPMEFNNAGEQISWKCTMIVTEDDLGELPLNFFSSILD